MRNTEFVTTVFLDPWTDVADKNTVFTFRLAEVLTKDIDRLRCRLWQLDSSQMPPEWKVVQDWRPFPPEPQKSRYVGNTAFQIDLSLGIDDVPEKAVWLGNLTIVERLSSNKLSLMRLLMIPVWSTPLSICDEVKYIANELAEVSIALISLREGREVSSNRVKDGRFFVCSAVSFELSAFEHYFEFSDRLIAAMARPAIGNKRLQLLAWIILTIAEGYRHAEVNTAHVRSLHATTAHCGTFSYMLGQVLEASGFSVRVVEIDGPLESQHAVVECFIAETSLVIDAFAGALAVASVEEIREGGVQPETILGFWPDQEPLLDVLGQIVNADTLWFEVQSIDRTVRSTALAARAQ